MATASKTVRNIQTVEVVKSSAVVEDGEIVEYRVVLKIGFEYDGADGRASRRRGPLTRAQPASANRSPA